MTCGSCVDRRERAAAVILRTLAGQLLDEPGDSQGLRNSLFTGTGRAWPARSPGVNESNRNARDGLLVSAVPNQRPQEWDRGAWSHGLATRAWGPVHCLVSKAGSTTGASGERPESLQNQPSLCCVRLA